MPGLWNSELVVLVNGLRDTGGPVRVQFSLFCLHLRVGQGPRPYSLPSTTCHIQLSRVQAVAPELLLLDAGQHLLTLMCRLSWVPSKDQSWAPRAGAVWEPACPREIRALLT